MGTFNSAANSYDSTFTNSLIGALQRQVIWNYLDKFIEELGGRLKILELNGGTGEDAFRFAEKGCDILCTDLSEDMLEVARSKVEQSHSNPSISFRQLDVRELHLIGDQKFDLVFSNFGGLNCIDPAELKYFFKSIQNYLNDNGRFVGVFLGRFCLWETLYFLLKGNRMAAYRRGSKEAVVANVNGEEVSTWYYSSYEIETLTNGKFDKVKMLPVGAFLPPSYLNPFFKNKLRILGILNKLESNTSNFSSFAGIADHYLIDLKKRAS